MSGRAWSWKGCTPELATVLVGPREPSHCTKVDLAGTRVLENALENLTSGCQPAQRPGRERSLSLACYQNSNECRRVVSTCLTPPAFIHRTLLGAWDTGERAMVPASPGDPGWALLTHSGTL